MSLDTNLTKWLSKCECSFSREQKRKHNIRCEYDDIGGIKEHRRYNEAIWNQNKGRDKENKKWKKSGAKKERKRWRDEESLWKNELRSHVTWKDESFQDEWWGGTTWGDKAH